MWNHDWTALILRRLKLESVRSGRSIMKTRVLFLTTCTFLAYMSLRSPARSYALFLFLRQRRRSSNGCSATSSRRCFQPSSASDQLQQHRDLNQSSHSLGTQPLLVEQPLALLRDSSFRVPPNSYSVSEPSTLPSFSVFLYSVGPAALEFLSPIAIVCRHHCGEKLSTVIRTLDHRIYERLLSGHVGTDVNSDGGRESELFLASIMIHVYRSYPTS